MTLLVDDTADATLDTAFIHFTFKERGTYRIVQVEITATATVLIQGRLSARFPWATIETFTQSDAKSAALFTHMRVSLSDNTGNVSVEIDA